MLNIRKKAKIIDKKSVFIDKTISFGKNVVIYENNRLEGNCVIGDNVTILPGCHLKNVIVKNGCVIESSNIENAELGENCVVGPFARIRPKTILKNNVKIGNFVEIKNSIIGDGSKVNHLAYVGDAEIGKNCNIGCGAIFVNYNGKIKQKSTVGDNSFIGSNVNIIAPVIIEKNSFICAGTTVTNFVKEDSFVIGRVKQEIKENRAHEYLKKKGE